MESERSPLRPYQYTALGDEEIRVLVLEPDAPGSPLRGRLLHVRLPAQELAVDVSSGEESHEDVEAETPETDLPADIEHKMADQRDPGTGRSASPSSTQSGMSLREQHTVYEAISYTWGSNEKPYRIIIGEQNYVDITLSLHEALQQFRYPDMQRTLWADALCINQADAAEKSIQVGKMGDIYRSACQTVVWLGESEGHDWLAVALLQMFWQWPWDHKQNVSSNDMHEALLGVQHFCTCCPVVDARTCGSSAYVRAAEGLRYLLNRPWFSRLWILQEVSLAPDLIFQTGTHTTYLFLIEWFITSIGWGAQQTDSRWFDRGPLRQLDTLTLMHVSDIVSTCQVSDLEESESFLTTLLKSFSKGCSDPRDRIYAVRSISDIRSYPELSPDYNLGAGKLFRMVTAAYLLDDVEHRPHQSLLLAMVPLTRSSSSAAVPSWAPDFHNVTPYYQVMHDRYFGGSSAPFQTDALRCQYICENHTKVGSEIELAGRAFGKILDVLKQSELSGLLTREAVDLSRYDSVDLALPEVIDSTTFLLWVLRCGAFIGRWRESLLALPGQSLEFPLNRRDPENGLRRRARQSLDYPLALVDPPMYTFNVRSIAGKCSSSDATRESMHELLEAMSESVGETWNGLSVAKARYLLCQRNGLIGEVGHNRILAAVSTTDGTLLGWVPKLAEVGDEVCIVYGAPYPFVMPRCPERPANELVGDAYFDGLTETLAIGTDIDRCGHLRFC
ncbi:hypothetical protein LTR56_015557 [Elasticomyces elasticus]|nr:hypothetical protein LTR56_015557 [Elasticomyces elasticus]KAK3648294.1 hypothetical protein LTR22_013425 [Elasticomyces elasticus]KAK4916284.1 hypothetical protein LTR49_015656 [Elasticomyces elasticus]KAK5764956.1 hypothetical protein LTS12_004984 [Elasticomyces elasticus]